MISGIIKTNRENTVILYCPHCEYRLPADTWPVIFAGEGRTVCGGCDANFHFVAFEHPVESSTAEGLVAHLPIREQL